jgi:allantoinase
MGAAIERIPLHRLKIKAILTINGSAISTYEPIAQAALDRGWDFIGHGSI